MSVIVKINSMLKEFTDSEKRLANYISSNINGVYNLTASQLAKLSSTSPASVVRFSKRLGYAGFQELKIALAKDVVKKGTENNDIYQQVSIEDSTADIISKIPIGNIKAIEATRDLLDIKAIEEATKGIIKAKRVHLFGVGQSALVAMDLQYKLIRINIPVNMSMDYHLQLVSAVNVQKDDVVIAISHHGKTLETIKAVEIAKKSGAKIISLTKYGKNPLTELSDIKLYTTEVEQTLRMGAIASRIAQLTVIDVLFINIVRMKFDSIPEQIKKTREVLDFRKI
ncbi:MurR/RpiR family transcriptional regulator [Clostridiaceae bacterium M8S5]|nr:MurR/RpiR family transcriptional regulator [Clostridiaceae bacterium M8S5]